MVVGSLKATAKCKEGTAAWTAFQTSRILSSWQLQDRCLEGSPLLVPLTSRPRRSHTSNKWPSKNDCRLLVLLPEYKLSLFKSALAYPPCRFQVLHNLAGLQYTYPFLPLQGAQ